MRKPPPKTAPKKDEEPSKKDQRKEVLEQQKTATSQQPPPPPTIETPPATNPEEEERRVPLIQSKIKFSFHQRFYSNLFQWKILDMKMKVLVVLLNQLKKSNVYHNQNLILSQKINQVSFPSMFIFIMHDF